MALRRTIQYKPASERRLVIHCRGSSKHEDKTQVGFMRNVNSTAEHGTVVGMEKYCGSEGECKSIKGKMTKCTLILDRMTS